MATSYNVEVQIGDDHSVMTAESHGEAINVVYGKLLHHYFAEANLPGVPQPTTEQDLQSAINDFDLKASFRITAA